MRTLRFEKSRRANLWIGELPGAAYPVHHTFTEVYPAVHRTDGKNKAAAVELFIPTGARALYGLLGGQFAPGSGESIKIEICVSDQNEHVFTSALGGLNDKICVGLPGEYVDGITAGMKLAKTHLSTLGPGVLQINCAAHGEVGSSRLIFKYLALILVKLLNSAEISPADEDLLKLFPSTYL